VHATEENGTDNLWLQPLDGSPGRQLTDFTDGTIDRIQFFTGQQISRCFTIAYGIGCCVGARYWCFALIGRRRVLVYYTCRRRMRAETLTVQCASATFCHKHAITRQRERSVAGTVHTFVAALTLANRG
jgi:hypothetical protein